MLLRGEQNSGDNYRIHSHLYSSSYVLDLDEIYFDNQLWNMIESKIVTYLTTQSEKKQNFVCKPFLEKVSDMINTLIEVTKNSFC